MRGRRESTAPSGSQGESLLPTTCLPAGRVCLRSSGTMLTGACTSQVAAVAFLGTGAAVRLGTTFSDRAALRSLCADVSRLTLAVYGRDQAGMLFGFGARVGRAAAEGLGPAGCSQNSSREAVARPQLLSLARRASPFEIARHRANRRMHQPGRGRLVSTV